MIGAIPRREPLDIRLIRTCLQRWPIPDGRGRGLILRLLGPRLRDRDFVFDAGGGIFLQGDLGDDVTMSRFLALNYKREAPIEWFARTLIGPGDTAIDVGANMGLWAMAAARRAGPGGAVHAFEPVPGNFDLLIRNLGINGIDSVHGHRLALADRSGETTFYASSVDHSVGSLARHDLAVDPIRVTISTLDDFCAERGIERVAALKVDVEGAEALVFRGGYRLLSAPDAPAIVFEALERNAAMFGSSVGAVKALLVDRGYTIYRYKGGGLQRVETCPAQEFEDLIALKPGHLIRHPNLATLGAS